MLIREVKMSFNDLDLRELDKDLSPKEKRNGTTFIPHIAAAQY